MSLDVITKETNIDRLVEMLSEYPSGTPGADTVRATLDVRIAEKQIAAAESANKSSTVLGICMCVLSLGMVIAGFLQVYRP